MELYKERKRQNDRTYPLRYGSLEQSITEGTAEEMKAVGIQMQIRIERRVKVVGSNNSRKVNDLV